MSASSALQFFRDSTFLQAMPDEALQRLSEMGDGAEGEMRNIAEVMRGMGCVISVDAINQHQGGSCSGSLQTGSEVSVMLFFLAESLQAQIEALHIAANSETILRERQLAMEKEVRHA